MFYAREMIVKPQQALLAAALAAICVTSHAQQSGKSKEVMICGVGWLTLYEAAIDAKEIVMMRCGAPINREKVPLAEVYAQGWQLIQSIRTATQHTTRDATLFIFER